MYIQVRTASIRSKFSKEMINCPVCNNQLVKNVEMIRESRDCRACNLGVLPRPGDCECTYYDVEALVVNCVYCDNECARCDKQRDHIIEQYCGVSNEMVKVTSRYCKKCTLAINEEREKINEEREKEEREKLEKQKQKFNNIWKNGTIKEKLNCYGLPKLKYLAKNKQMKGYSGMSKDNLIDKLLTIVTDKDLPIK
jgi:uncharacterized protein (DUF2225 family)